MGPQTKATIWNAVFTLSLLLVTSFYAWFTLDMSKSMFSQLEQTQLEYNIAYRPYIHIDKFDFRDEKYDSFQRIINIKNSGLVPAKLKVEKYCFNDEDNCSEENDYSYIFPNSNGIKLGSLGSTTEELIEGDSELKIILKFKYWSIYDNLMKKTYFYESNISIFRDPNDSRKFIYSREDINAN